MGLSWGNACGNACGSPIPVT
jgi:hypothetical protein